MSTPIYEVDPTYEVAGYLGQLVVELRRIADHLDRLCAKTAGDTEVLCTRDHSNGGTDPVRRCVGWIE